MRFLSAGLLAYFLFLSGGCSDPGRVSSAPPPLTGEYEGVYRVTHNWGDSAHQFTASNNVLWTFDEWRYYFRIDSARHTGHCFCAVTGLYTLREGIHFQMITAVVDNVGGCRHCDPSEAPAGEFVRETKGDSLIFRRQADSLFIESRLLRVR